MKMNPFHVKQICYIVVNVTGCVMLPLNDKKYVLKVMSCYSPLPYYHSLIRYMYIIDFFLSIEIKYEKSILLNIKERLT